MWAVSSLCLYFPLNGPALCSFSTCCAPHRWLWFLGFGNTGWPSSPWGGNSFLTLLISLLHSLLLGFSAPPLAMGPVLYSKFLLKYLGWFPIKLKQYNLEQVSQEMTLLTVTQGKFNIPSIYFMKYQTLFCILLFSLRGRDDSSAVGVWFFRLDPHLFWDPPPWTLSIFVSFPPLAFLQALSLQSSNMSLSPYL